MTRDLFSAPPSGSSTALAATPANTVQAQRDRAAWILQRARLVFGAYRKDEFADPEIFLSQLGLVLERYPDTVIERVTDVRNPDSLQRRCKFPPSIAEAGEILDAEGAAQARDRHYAALPGFVPREPRMPVKPANTLIRCSHPAYASLCERARVEPDMVRSDDQGLWVPLGWVETIRAKTFRRFTREDLERIYARHGEGDTAVPQSDSSDRAPAGTEGPADVGGRGAGGPV